MKSGTGKAKRRSGSSIKVELPDFSAGNYFKPSTLYAIMNMIG